ncbi:hypothetical protein [Rhodococcus sp. NPDC127528]|uniref:hypothetical protein n=1 Tax=unclassified Rhodococcus (in: high G+C Gram-positive bacteria) TaxID=192944 RepID=UPI00363AAEB0
MRIERLIGERVRDLRKELPSEDGKEVTQEELGQRLGAYLEKSWSRQAVSAAEKGERSFAAVELVALAAVLGIAVGDLLKPKAGVESISMPSGTSIEARMMSQPGGVGDESMPTLLQHEVLDQLDRIAEALGNARAISRLASESIPGLEKSWDTTSRVLDHLVGKSEPDYTAGPPKGSGE